MSGISISGTDSGNYTVNTTTTATANITAKALTVIAVADNKEYDGNTTAMVTLADNRVSGDVLTASKTTSTFDTRNIGSGKTVTVSGISISGTDAGNYTVNNTATATANITAKALTVTAVADNKEYDGSNTATVTLADDRVSGDVLTASKTTSTFDTKDIGSGKPVTVSGISISGTDAANYNLLNPTATATANITAKALTVTAVADNKEYDGNTTATVTLADDRVSGDVLTAAKTASAFDTKNVGTGKPVTVSGISISGTDSGNYTVNATTTATANITAKALTVTAVADNKEYDGNNTATVTLADNRVSGDVLTASKTTSTFDTKDIGSGKPVTVSGISISGTDAANYNLLNPTATATANITAKALTVTAVADNKEYDGNTTAMVTLADNRVSGDVLTASKTASAFDTKDIGSGKTVTISGISISGTDAGNYTVNTTTTATANITAKALTVTAVADNKEYDGNTTAMVTLADNRVSGDVLTASKTTSTFDTRNIGSGKTVTVSGISISGTDAGNYTVNNTATATANITAKALTVTAVADNKEYDGSNTATVTLADDRVSGDVLTASKTTSTFDTKDIGSGKPVTVSGISISGTDAANYNLLNPTATATANITAKALTVTAVADNKEYDGNTTATVTLADDRVSGDVLTAAKTASAFDTKNVGTGKPVTVSGISISGTDSGNYTVNATTTATANITAKALTVTAVADNKEYDGNTTAMVTLADNRVSGDVLTAAKTASAFDTKNVGTGKPVTVSGISISGTDSGNYTVNATTTATANITAKALTVTAVADNKEYDGNTTAMVTLADNRVSGDVLTASKTASAFDTKDIGSGKTVTISGISISGTDAGNYTVNTTTTATANITAKALTITADNKVKIYGSANPALTTSYSGFIVGEDENGITLPLINSIADLNSPSGDYPIVLSGGSAANYELTLVNGTLTVNKALLTVTAENKRRVIKNNNPELTFTYSGFKNTDDSSILHIQPIASTIVVPLSPAGIYPIVVSGGISDKYDFTYIGGTLKIAPFTGDINDNGIIEGNEIVGDTNDDGQIISPEIAGDANGDGIIDTEEISGDINGNGTIGTGEVSGDASGNGNNRRK